MARYTSSYLVNLPLEQLPQAINKILQSCGFESVYHATDYMMAREIPGEVVFSKLVTVEILIDSTKAKIGEIPITWVIKNDELPLQVTNHCQQRFGQIQEIISQHQQWNLIASAAN
ncbi:MAG: hypothetical protein ACTMUB_05025 [cyanobacterium endosymbiont of Rhopalodia musculus]|uniref:hypothetical protein n=1 Tax=cyanobacterium endosymbiont of Epithemia clementina EcSB TaxID=3034674 RepID=UPI002481728A|nr:hypothetical protein [cyanobacterium endosymbiont of Epithemia clementina EcSB]WGT67518.1 hypothetical protein P3F56_10110 [cyanobacterium endosymbiont of Epithemia clementina EcSB]